MQILLAALLVVATIGAQLPVSYQTSLFHDATVTGPGIRFDADGDGDQDWLHSDRSLRLQRNLGHGLTEIVPIAVAAQGPCAVGDMDGDGDIDIVVGGFVPSLILANDGTGVFTALNSPAPQTRTIRAVALWDPDNDGDLDVYEAHGVLRLRVAARAARRPTLPIATMGRAC